MRKYLELIRVKHWVKNLLVFVPLIFSKLIGYDTVFNTILGFLSFSFLSSFIYIVNDIRDIEKDKLHPRKKNRPLPSGKVKKRTAIIIAVLMITLSVIINIIIHNNILNISLYFLIGYFVINIAYSFGLKNIAIIDIILLATGFVLRVYYGASIINVQVSNWLFLTVLNASLFLGLGKRKKELLNNKKSRKVLEQYNEAFLDKFQYLTLSLTLVFYSLWTINQNINYMYLSIPFVIMIMMRYCLVVEECDEGDPTTILYQDKLLLIMCVVYGISMLVLLELF